MNGAIITNPHEHVSISFILDTAVFLQKQCIQSCQGSSNTDLGLPHVVWQGASAALRQNSTLRGSFTGPPSPEALAQEASKLWAALPPWVLPVAVAAGLVLKLHFHSQA